MRVAAAILAGGRARRLGGAVKGLLVVRGRRIVDRQLDELGSVFARVFIVANDPAPWRELPVACVPDRVAGAGPLAGIDAALAALRDDEDAVVCVGGDMPFLAARLLQRLRDEAPEADAVVARVGDRPEPLCARYGRSAAVAIRTRLAAGRLRATELLDDLRVAFVETQALDNVNTREDLERLR
jgi:molybdopterin-guanine dinucleotide biosynthesis protein A